MVGYAYSVDRNYGYRYLLIKCYDTDNICFVTDSMPYCVYRVCRTDCKVTLAYSSPGFTAKRLSLKHIENIMYLLKLSDYERGYPSCMEWMITPSGILRRGGIKDLYITFPLSPGLMETKASYINITSVCFKEHPSILDVSFLCHILNEVFCFCNIPESEPFSVSGNQLFCTKHTAKFVKEVFSKDLFGLKELNSADKTRVRYKASKRRILKALNSLTFNHGEYSGYDNKNLVLIKRECIESMVNIFKRAVSGEDKFLRTKRLITLCISRTLCDIKNMSLTFLSKSGAARSTDINFVSFDYLMHIFNFPVSHTKVRGYIRLNADRMRKLKETDAPKIIYKGKFYY